MAEAIISRRGGGGGGLNFKVVGGTSQPTNPRENTIWVNTSTTITDWVFSTTQPTSAPGRVWILTGTFSNAEFNALKKNGIYVYPISAKQYVSGAWVDKPAKSYQHSAWRDWYVEEWIIKNGQTSYAITNSGWKTTQNTNSIKFQGADYGNHESYVKADLTSHKVMKIEGSFSLKSTAKLCVWELSKVPNYDNAAASANLTRTGASLDISNFNGEYYIGFTGEYTDPHTVTNWVLTR